MAAEGGIVNPQSRTEERTRTSIVATDYDTLVAVRGDVVIRHDTEPRSVRKTAAIVDALDCLGVVSQPFDSTAFDVTQVTAGVTERVVVVTEGEAVPTKIPDNDTLAFNAHLTTDENQLGTLRLAVSTETVVGICVKAITVGAVDQLTNVDWIKHRFIEP